MLSEHLIACSYMLNMNLQNMLIMLDMLLQINATAFCTKLLGNMHSS